MVIDYCVCVLNIGTLLLYGLCRPVVLGSGFSCESIDLQTVLMVGGIVFV